MVLLCFVLKNRIFLCPFLLIMLLPPFCENVHLLDGERITHGALGHTWAHLHHIISHFILPKGNSFDKVSYMNCLIMYALKSKTILSFGYLMMRHMNECVYSNKGAFLPYELFLTKFFEYFHVDLEN